MVKSPSAGRGLFDKKTADGENRIGFQKKLV
jgi:hypothetical protein